MKNFIKNLGVLSVNVDLSFFSFYRFTSGLGGNIRNSGNPVHHFLLLYVHRTVAASHERQQQRETQPRNNAEPFFFLWFRTKVS